MTARAATSSGVTWARPSVTASRHPGASGTCPAATASRTCMGDRSRCLWRRRQRACCLAQWPHVRRCSRHSHGDRPISLCRCPSTPRGDERCGDAKKRIQNRRKAHARVCRLRLVTGSSRSEPAEVRWVVPRGRRDPLLPGMRRPSFVGRRLRRPLTGPAQGTVGKRASSSALIDRRRSRRPIRTNRQADPNKPVEATGLRAPA
jgi:hypothetical protein